VENPLRKDIIVFIVSLENMMENIFTEKLILIAEKNTWTNVLQVVNKLLVHMLGQWINCGEKLNLNALIQVKSLLMVNMYHTWVNLILGINLRKN